MAVILETLSVKKLLALGLAIIAILVIFFYIGSKGKEFHTFRAKMLSFLVIFF